jgi:glutathione S-transferase
MSKIYDVLTLYHFESCPFCQKVRRFIKEHGMTIPEKDIKLDSAARDELIGIGGKAQVPCLVIDGVALYESGDIITWLEENWEPQV